MRKASEAPHYDLPPTVYSLLPTKKRHREEFSGWWLVVDAFGVRCFDSDIEMSELISAPLVLHTFGKQDCRCEML